MRTLKEMGEVMRVASEGCGNILIPAFAVGRTQELLYSFQQHYQNWVSGWNIFVDSPMAIAATEVYDRHWHLHASEAAQARKDNGSSFTLPNLHFSRTTNQSMAINKVRSGAIVIAGSGMCTGGRIKYHSRVWRSAGNCLDLTAVDARCQFIRPCEI